MCALPFLSFIQSTRGRDPPMTNSSDPVQPDPIVGRISVTESDVRNGLLSGDQIGAYPGWVERLSKRDLRQLVTEAQDVLRDTGELSRVFVAIGSARFKEYIKADCRAEIRRRSPRF